MMIHRRGRPPKALSAHDPATAPVLVCEGDCNPSLPAYDAAVRRFRATLKSASKVRVAGEEWDAVNGAVRQLRHTVHTPVLRPRHWACTTCGAEREY